MIDFIENKIKNALLDCGTLEGTRAVLKETLESIEEYKKTNETTTSMHTAFRALEDYNTQYTTLVSAYNADSSKDYAGLSLKVQKILCVITLASSMINIILKKYTTSNDTGTIAKYLRMLNEQKEHFKNEKIVWQGVLKSLSTLVADTTQDKALATKELEFKIRTQHS